MNRQPSLAVNNIWLGFLRVSVASFALFHFLSILPDFNNIYTFSGYVQPDIMDVSMDHFSPTLYDITLFLQRIFEGITFNQVAYTAAAGYCIALLLLALGCFTRVSAGSALLLQLVMIKSVHFYQYGVDLFTTILLFYCLIFPTGTVYSLDNYRLKRQDNISNTLPYLRLLQVHICIAYFIGGLDKLAGFTWHNGEAVWKATTGFNYSGFFNVTSLASFPLLFVIGGWGVIILEMMYPLFINLRKTRKLWFWMIVSMHLGIALLLGLFFFSAVMIIFSITAYYMPYVKERVQPVFSPALT